MAVTILEALQNAEINLHQNNCFTLDLAKNQLHNAVILLIKEYDLSDLVEPLLEKYGDVENVPEKNI